MSTGAPSDGTVFEAQTNVHRRSFARVAPAFGAAVVSVFALVAAFAFAPGPVPAWLLLTPLPFVGMLFIEAYVLAVAPARVVASREGVFVDGRRALAAGSFADAVYEPMLRDGMGRPGRGGLVRFMGPRRKTLLAVVVRDDDEARRLLDAAGADVAGRSTFTAPASTATAPSGSNRVVPWWIWFCALFTLPLNLLLPLEAKPIALAVYFALMGVVGFYFRAGRRIHVGAGTLQIDDVSSFRKERTTLAQLGAIEAVGEHAIRLVHENAPEAVVHVGSSVLLENGRLVTLRDLLVARIRIALAYERQRAEMHALLEQLARGMRSASAWSDELRKLRSGHYRSLSLRDDDLWSVVENPAVPDDARAAAALLLDRDEGSRASLRVAAAETASPRLRVALDSLARGTQPRDAVDDVVTSLELDEKAHRARSLST